MKTKKTKVMALNYLKTIVRSGLRIITKVWIIRNQLKKLTWAGLLPDSVWRRLPVETAFEVQLPDGCSFRYSSIAEDEIGRALFWRGVKSWEAETLQVFFWLARESRLILDIGANTGVFSLVACAANVHARVIAFEPVPHVYKRLSSHIKQNGFGNRCEARNQAVSNVNGSAKLHVPYGVLPTSASLNTQGFRGYRGELVDVPVTTVDALFSQTDQIDLIKIDVEGFEDKVLEGMQQTLARSRPSIIVECNPDGPYEVVEAILATFGYKFYALRSEGPIKMNRITPDSTGRFRNFLCTPRSLRMQK